MNMFVNQQNTEPVPVLKLDAQTIKNRQIQNLNSLKQNRDEKNTQNALNQLTKAAQNKTCNLVEASLNAARTGASLGEISLALEKVYGRYQANI